MSVRALFETGNSTRSCRMMALPIAAQSMVFSALNAVDVLLIGQLGETSVASVALANQFTFLLQLFLFGIASGMGIFTAQFWGKGDCQASGGRSGWGWAWRWPAARLFTTWV